MKYSENILEIATLQPDYMGFIFWAPSPRFFNGDIPTLPDSIKKTGIFVNADLHTLKATVEKYQLQAVQLHGKEHPEYCEQLYWDFAAKNIEIIKVFSVKDNFDFKQLEAYETACHYFLFDTRGKLPGGNGTVFNWKILNAYPSEKPFFLSGGIGTEAIKNIKNILKTSLPVYAIDVNSRFEIHAGYKDGNALKTFIKLLYSERKDHDLSRK